jgi:uncharacterized protein YcbX
MHLSEINIYPIKSLKGIALTEAKIEARGLGFDRRWMLVDEHNKFITQREFPKMATLAVEIHNDHLKVLNSHDRVDIPFEAYGDAKARVTVWGSTVKADVYQPVVNHWFSERLGLECKLVRMPETTNRLVNPEYAVRRYEDTVSFADGYPFLLIGQASLDDLNSRLAEPVPMNRFRPNFVVEGAEPFAEDSWKKISIGKTVFHVVKPCERCVITTIDQVKGTKGKEPLTTLNTFRNFNDKVLFGQNLIAEKPGAVLKVGDKIEIVEVK